MIQLGRSDAKHYKVNDVEMALCRTMDVKLENHSNAQNIYGYG